jgi:hypothetical protein
VDRFLSGIVTSLQIVLYFCQLRHLPNKFQTSTMYPLYLYRHIIGSDNSFLSYLFPVSHTCCMLWLVEKASSSGTHPLVSWSLPKWLALDCYTFLHPRKRRWTTSRTDWRLSHDNEADRAPWHQSNKPCGTSLPKPAPAVCQTGWVKSAIWSVFTEVT